MEIDIQVTSTISLVEIFIVILALIGLVAAFGNIAAARADAARIRRSGKNGSMRRTVNGNVREETLRVVKLGIFLIIGVLFMFGEPPIRDTNATIDLVAGLLVLVMESLMTYGSLASWYDRVRLKQDWETEQAARDRAAAVEVAAAKWDGHTERRGRP